MRGAHFSLPGRERHSRQAGARWLVPGRTAAAAAYRPLCLSICAAAGPDCNPAVRREGLKGLPQLLEQSISRRSAGRLSTERQMRGAASMLRRAAPWALCPPPVGCPEARATMWEKAQLQVGQNVGGCMQSCWALPARTCWHSRPAGPRRRRFAPCGFPGPGAAPQRRQGWSTPPAGV